MPSNYFSHYFIELKSHAIGVNDEQHYKMLKSKKI